MIETIWPLALQLNQTRIWYPTHTSLNFPKELIYLLHPRPTNSQAWTHHKTQTLDTPAFLFRWHTHALQPEDQSIHHLQSNYTREHKLSMDLKSQSFIAPIKISHCLSLFWSPSTAANWPDLPNAAEKKGNQHNRSTAGTRSTQCSSRNPFLLPHSSKKREFYVCLSTTFFS
jgi:hypothetical protein